uniref:Uncharacterized protein n=1 Tax=Anguilla anguilla TaxID=7936 RepID=A0A0E9XCH4_ANGAN
MCRPFVFVRIPGVSDDERWLFVNSTPNLFMRLT